MIAPHEPDAGSPITHLPQPLILLDHYALAVLPKMVHISIQKEGFNIQCNVEAAFDLAQRCVEERNKRVFGNQ